MKENQIWQISDGHVKDGSIMNRDNTIGIVGYITAQPQLIVDAAEWTRKVYETTLTRTCFSKTEDTYILQFTGQATGSKEMFSKIVAGAEVLVGGEIRSENLRNPKPEENSVKVYIYAEIIVLNDPPANDQNEVKLCGHICKPPRLGSVRRKVTSIIVAVNSFKSTSYIPCVCFGGQADEARCLEVGDYVEIYGSFQSRNYQKRIEGRKLPFLCTTYEVGVIKFESNKLSNDQSRL